MPPQGTNTVTFYDDDNTLDCTGGTGTTCAGTKLQLGAEKLQLEPHDSATFMFISSIGGGSWLLANSFAWETIGTSNLVNNIGLTDTQNQVMLQVDVNEIRLGDDDAFTLKREDATNAAGGHTDIPGTDFVIAGQKGTGDRQCGRRNQDTSGRGRPSDGGEDTAAERRRVGQVCI